MALPGRAERERREGGRGRGWLLQPGPSLSPSLSPLLCPRPCPHRPVPIPGTRCWLHPRCRSCPLCPHAVTALSPPRCRRPEPLVTQHEAMGWKKAQALWPAPKSPGRCHAWTSGTARVGKPRHGAAGSVTVSPKLGDGGGDMRSPRVPSCPCSGRVPRLAGDAAERRRDRAWHFAVLPPHLLRSSSYFRLRQFGAFCSSRPRLGAGTWVAGGGLKDGAPRACVPNPGWQPQPQTHPRTTGSRDGSWDEAWGRGDPAAWDAPTLLQQRPHVPVPHGRVTAAGTGTRVAAQPGSTLAHSSQPAN